MPQPYNIKRPPHLIANELLRRFEELLHVRGIDVKLEGRFRKEAEQLVRQMQEEKDKS